jgi:hypothetical protein
MNGGSPQKNSSTKAETNCTRTRKNKTLNGSEQAAQVAQSNETELSISSSNNVTNLFLGFDRFGY